MNRTVGTIMCGKAMGKLACAALLLSALPGLGQEKELVAVQFISLPMTLEPRIAHLVVGDNETLEIEMPSNEFSPIYKVPRRDAWELAAKPSKPAEAGEPRILGSAPMGQTGRQLVVVAFPDPKENAPLRLIPMDSRAAGSSFIIVNATRDEFSGEMGIERFSIAPNAYVQVTPEAAEDKGGRPMINVAFHKVVDEQVEPFFRQQWRLDERSFSVVILRPDSDHDKIGLHVVRQFLGEVELLE